MIDTYYLFESAFKFNNDWSILGGDLETITTYADVLRQNIRDRLISNRQDYRDFPEYGLKISDFTGRGVDEALAQEIANRIEDTLAKESYISPANYDLHYIINNNLIHYRLIFQDDSFVTVAVNVIEEGINVE